MAWKEASGFLGFRALEFRAFGGWGGGGGARLLAHMTDTCMYLFVLFAGVDFEGSSSIKIPILKICIGPLRIRRHISICISR